MDLKNLLKSMPLPAIYKRDGKECYFDTYRKKLIEITPEETVRQKIAKLFEIKYGVPEEMISLEVPMSYYAAGVSGRADIVIHLFPQLRNHCLYLHRSHRALQKADSGASGQKRKRIRLHVPLVAFTAPPLL